jgi:hypothetical protein
MPGKRFMVSLSNHEATRAVGAAKPSWFDKLTMKALSLAVARMTVTVRP